MNATGDMRAARRYADALFQVALARNEVDDVAQNLSEVTAVLQAAPQLLNVLRHPRITRTRKKEVLDHLFGGAVREDVSHFLFLLIEKNRAAIIPDAAREFARLLDEHRNQVEAEAVSAVPISSEQEASLLQQLQTVTQQSVRLRLRVDETILGGLVVHVGDKLLDLSVATQLRTLRDRLRQVKVT